MINKNVTTKFKRGLAVLGRRVGIGLELDGLMFAADVEAASASY
jgi:hypothetical protein